MAQEKISAQTHWVICGSASTYSHSGRPAGFPNAYAPVTRLRLQHTPAGPKKSFLFAQCLHNYRRYRACNRNTRTQRRTTMSVQSISSASVQPYQAYLPAVQNPAQQSGQTSAGQQVKKGGGHHHHSKTQQAGYSQGATPAGGTSTTLTASAVSSAGSSQSASNNTKSSGSLIDLYA